MATETILMDFLECGVEIRRHVFWMVIKLESNFSLSTVNVFSTLYISVSMMITTFQ